MSELEEIANKIVEQAVNNVTSAPGEYWESLIEKIAIIKSVGVEKINVEYLEDIINQGWDINDLRIIDIDDTYNGIGIHVKAPNGYVARIIVMVKGVSELNKEEFQRFKEIFDRLVCALKVKRIERKKKKLEEEIKKLEREIGELREEKRRIEEYCEEKKKECDITYEDARNMLRFINEKGLLDEYIDWINKDEKEEIKSKMLSYYGLVDDYDC